MHELDNGGLSWLAEAGRITKNVLPGHGRAISIFLRIPIFPHYEGLYTAISSRIEILPHTLLVSHCLYGALYVIVLPRYILHYYLVPCLGNLS